MSNRNDNEGNIVLFFILILGLILITILGMVPNITGDAMVLFILSFILGIIGILLVASAVTTKKK